MFEIIESYFGDYLVAVSPLVIAQLLIPPIQVHTMKYKPRFLLIPCFKIV